MKHFSLSDKGPIRKENQDCSATETVRAARCDIAVVCDRDIPVGNMIETILANGGQYLRECSVFDVYTGTHVAEGKKSVAFSLTMRADDQTLTDEHAEETVKKVLLALAKTHGAVMR